MENKNTPAKKQAQSPEALNGKKAINAERKAKGEDPASEKVKKKEAEDAEKWRNEG